MDFLSNIFLDKRVISEMKMRKPEFKTMIEGKRLETEMVAEEEEWEISG